jgi:hypothetical protein
LERDRVCGLGRAGEGEESEEEGETGTVHRREGRV